jgi:hypothetical protein
MGFLSFTEALDKSLPVKRANRKLCDPAVELAHLLTRQVLVSASFMYTSSLGRILPQSVHDKAVSL